MRSVQANIAVRIISLAGSHERRRLIVDNFRDFPIPWEFFDACTYDSPTRLSLNPADQINQAGRVLTKTEIGCFKSHFEVLTLFDADPSLDWLLVFEDDVLVDPAFPFRALADLCAEKSLPFMKLFCREWKSATCIGRFQHFQILRFRTDPYGAQAYLISRDAAAKLRARITTIERPIDDEHARFWDNGFDVFGVFPFPVIERYVQSTLLVDRSVSISDRPKKTRLRKIYQVRDYSLKNLSNIFFDLRRRLQNAR